MVDLKACYETLHPYITWEPEPWEVISAVEAHRQFWKPAKVTTLLLAESHVYTTLADLSNTLKPSFLEPGCPNSLVNLVYCLGYGEKELLTTPIRGSGTPQYWKIFQSCLSANPNFRELQKGGTTLSHRIAAKTQLLKQLKARGIWLADASPIALYGIPNHPKPAGKQYQNILKCSWDNYIQPLIQAEKPQQLICIGKGVWNALGEKLLTETRNKSICIAQPQGIRDAQLLKDSHLEYYKTCSVLFGQ